MRYKFFEDVRKKRGFDLIAVAHNMDDQAETVLMRIIRGSGLNGLGAMKAKVNSIVRPLLSISRKEILAYIEQKNLVYRVDKSNFDTKFTRNSIRHGLLPYLEKNFNPAIMKTLSEWSTSVAEDYDFIDKSAERFVLKVCKPPHQCQNTQINDTLSLSAQAYPPVHVRNYWCGGKIKCGNFSAESFLKLHPSIQRQVLRNVLEKLRGIQDVENKQIEELIKVIKGGKSKTSKASIAGLNISKNGDKVSISL
jgi:hypothetical protein